MSQPSPLVVEFVTKGIDKVLNDMKSIADTVARLEKKSSAVTRAGTDERTKARDKEVKQAAKAVASTSDMLSKSEKAGTATLSRELRTRLENQTRHLNAVYAKHQKHLDSINQKSRALSKDVQATKEREFKALERQIHQRQRTEERAAAKLVSVEKNVSKQLLAERRKTELAIMRGEIGSRPSLSPKARLQVLKDAEGRTLEHQRAAIAKARDMAAENKALGGPKRAALQKELVDHTWIEKQMTKETEKEEKARAAFRDRMARMKGKALHEQSMKEAAERRTFRENLAGSTGRVLRNTSIAGAAVGGLLFRGVTGVGGGFGVQDSVQREVQLRGQAATLSSSSKGEFSGQQLLSKARAIGTAQAMDPSEVLRGFDEMKKMTGDMSMAVRVMPAIAKIATASGADLGELGGLTGNIIAGNENLQSKPGDTPEQTKRKQAAIERQVRLFTQQGIVGGVEIGDFAKYGARITGGASLFGGNREENEAVLGGMAQIARQKGTATSPAEATMAALRFGTDVQKHAGSLKKQGIEVTDGKGTLRNAEEIALDMLRKSGGDVTKLSGMGLGERGVKVLTGVADIYREHGGGAEGEKAVRAEFSKYKQVMSEEDVERRNKERLAEVDAQLTIAMNQLKDAVGTELVPKLKDLIPLLVQATPHIARLLESVVSLAAYFASNPFSGLSVVVAASITKEIAAAGLKSILENGLRQGLTSSLGGLSVAGATIAIASAMLLIDKLSDDEQKRQNKSANADIAAANAISGGIRTPQDLKKAEAAKAELESSIASHEQGGSKLFKALAIGGSIVADVATFGQAGAAKSVKEATQSLDNVDKSALESQKKSLELLTKAIEQAATKISAAGSAAGSGPPKPPNPTGPVSRR